MGFQHQLYTLAVITIVISIAMLAFLGHNSGGTIMTHIPSAPRIRFLIDCDVASTNDMLLNNALCWAKLRGLEATARELTVWCLSSQCCSDAKALGFQTIGDDDWVAEYRTLRAGYELNGPKIAHLDSLQLGRELTFHRLLEQQDGWLVRADADSCFLQDPLRYPELNSLDVFMSAQEVLGDMKLPYWATDYACPDSGAPMHVSLNGGVMVTKPSAALRWHVGMWIGRGIHVLAGGIDGNTGEKHDPDGWGQKAANMHMNASGLCFTVRSNPGTVQEWDGQPAMGSTHRDHGPQIRVGVFTVCSSCDQRRHCKAGQENTSFVIHANCLLGIKKQAFLREAGGWLLAEDWETKRDQQLAPGANLSLQSFLQSISVVGLRSRIESP